MTEPDEQAGISGASEQTAQPSPVQMPGKPDSTEAVAGARLSSEKTTGAGSRYTILVAAELSSAMLPPLTTLNMHVSLMLCLYTACSSSTPNIAKLPLVSRTVIFLHRHRPFPVPRLKNSGTQSQLKVTEFEEDVSNWGRQVMEDQDYEDDEMSHASLSSGLSPRESRPRVKPWDLAEGYKVGNSQFKTAW